mgnify:CR=1 FL=1
MEFHQLINQRSSIRNFTSRPVEHPKVETLKTSILQAPSSKANYPCHFYFVEDSEIINKLSQCKPHGASFIKEAPLIIIVAADPEISDVWIEDAAIATTYAMLEATNLGLGSCWVQIRLRNYNQELSSENYIKNLLEINNELSILSMLAIGYSANSENNRQENLYSSFTHIG